ncbi:Gfo/Idh/MocA family protein [Nocardiopsis suaedae]|uniref:Gfo/Idh/MocA family oxidoreductase n=1 Tax=Nocardiopsis suaedae TaxID=3018444 RepID=A0ABT4TQT1_9ACTN|nr:Gfo/Idh/MocA family oxidoreductase [Nocardiopsis suaedae]MDA2807048.1 Gfo/Idh/MocA family oxidoreductase [Nocardiopsis suaedae]
MPTGPAAPAGPVPVVLAGANGHGRSHLRNLRRLSDAGRVRLVGVCERAALADGALEGLGPVPVSDDLGGLIERTGARAAVLATPIHTHLPLARTALEHGAHVLLEKPPAPSAAEFDALCAASDAAGPACQIGFQSLGSAAVAAVRRMVAEGAVGEVRGIGAAGTWVRTSAYYARADWAGRRRLDGRDVVDGALTNPFAHAVATALAVAGADRTPPEGVEAELFHAHPIEADDTSCVRVRTRGGPPVSVAVTLCAEQARDPFITVHGSEGSIVLEYTRDRVALRRGREERVSVHPRTDLLENLLDHADGGARLLVPPKAVAGFMGVLEAVRTAPDPEPVPAEAQEAALTDEGLRRTVRGVDAAVFASAERVALFSEIGAPWAAGKGGRT